MKYVMDLKFDEEPNYKMLINSFKTLLANKDYELDYQYDWVTVKNNAKVLKDASICHSDEFEKAQDAIDSWYVTRKEPGK